MQGFGVHTSMWTMNWNREGAEHAVERAVHYGMDFIEIALLDPKGVDTAHTKALLEKNDLRAICSLGLPEPAWPSVHPDAAVEHLTAQLRPELHPGALHVVDRPVQDQAGHGVHSAVVARRRWSCAASAGGRRPSPAPPARPPIGATRAANRPSG